MFNGQTAEKWSESESDRINQFFGDIKTRFI